MKKQVWLSKISLTCVYNLDRYLYRVFSKVKFLKTNPFRSFPSAGCGLKEMINGGEIRVILIRI